jgi:hypothetical protein
MTLAIGVATRTDDDAHPERSDVYVMADSRLMDGERSLDNYLKAVSLGARSAAVAAGDSVPFTIAVDGARPFVAAAAAERQR